MNTSKNTRIWPAKKLQGQEVLSLLCKIINRLALLPNQDVDVETRLLIQHSPEEGAEFKEYFKYLFKKYTTHYREVGENIWYTLVHGVLS